MCKVNKESLMKTCMATAVVCALALPAFAANNGCDNEANDRINPEIALCSTHVYNIGGTTNKASETDKQLMRNVVALKTTAMTQQMYKQYEYLETMIRRFKTQLEKAVLTTKLQAAGADNTTAGGPSYAGVGTSSTANYNRDSGISLDGAQNCAQTGYMDAFSCLTSNIQLVINTANERKYMTEARKQLESDLAVAKNWNIICGSRGQYSRCDANKQPDTSNRLTACNNLSSSTIVQCAQSFNAVVSMAAYEVQRSMTQKDK